MTSPESSAPVVLVTGAARRIGAAIARELHAGGARVVLHCRQSRDAADALARTLNAERADSARVLVADLDDLAALRGLATAAQACWQRLDALVNNASAWRATPFAELEPAQFEQLVSANLRAPLFLAQACAPLLSDGGSIINLLDVHARRPVSGFSAYLATKGALWTLTEALALELAPRLRVNGVAPGHTLWTDDGSGIEVHERADELARIPLGRLAGAIEIARAVRFLLSDDASYITGAILPVDGGLRLR